MLDDFLNCELIANIVKRLQIMLVFKSLLVIDRASEAFLYINAAGVTQILLSGPTSNRPKFV